MIKLISFLVHGCWHKWRIIDTVNYNYKSEFKTANGVRYTLQCERCGTVKKKDLV